MWRSKVSIKLIVPLSIICFPMHATLNSMNIACRDLFLSNSFQVANQSLCHVCGCMQLQIQWALHVGIYFYGILFKRQVKVNTLYLRWLCSEHANEYIFFKMHNDILHTHWYKDSCHLKYWGWDKMATIFADIFKCIFLEMIVFQFKFNWN